MFTHGEISALRMANQRPWGEPFEDISSCVRSLAAMQAQEFVNAPYYRANGLTDFKKTNTLFAKALKGGQHLERKQMRAVLEKAGLNMENLAFTLTLMHAELDGVICSGAPRGKQQTYALIEERAPAMLGNAIESTVVDARTYWFGRDLPHPQVAQPRVDLVQGAR